MPTRWNGIHAGRDRHRDLLVAHQHLVEPRAGEAAEHRAADVERDQLAVEQAGHRPVARDGGRRDAVLHHQRLGRRQGRHRGLRPGLLTGPRGIAPKYFSTSGRASAASMSPASTSTALLGPYLSRNQLLDVGQAGGVEVGHRADRRVADRGGRRGRGSRAPRRTPGRRAGCRPGASRSGRRRAGYRACPGSPRRADGPCGRFP